MYAYAKITNVNLYIYIYISSVQSYCFWYSYYNFTTYVMCGDVYCEAHKPVKILTCTIGNQWPILWLQDPLPFEIAWVFLLLLMYVTGKSSRNKHYFHCNIYEFLT